MITLHHLEDSRSQRIIWLLEELGVDYTIKRYERNPKTNLAPESLKQVHPLGKSPVITDNDRTIAESGVIINYLMENYGKEKFSLDRQSAAFAQSQYWLQYAEGSLMPFMVLALIFEKVKTAPMPFFIRPIAKAIVGNIMKSYVSPNIETHMRFIEQHLSNNTWFAGDALSAADFQMIFPLETSMMRSPIADQCPHIKQFVERVHKMETYQSGLKKGGPYSYA